MTNQELNSNLHELVDGVNDNTVLRAIQVLLIKRIEKAELEIKQGKYVTIDQLEKEAENW